MGGARTGGEEDDSENATLRKENATLREEKRRDAEELEARGSENKALREEKRRDAEELARLRALLLAARGGAEPPEAMPPG